MESFDIDKWCEFVNLLTVGNIDNSCYAEKFQEMEEFLQDEAQPFQQKMNSLVADTLNSDGGFENLEIFFRHLCDKLQTDAEENLQTKRFYFMIITALTLADVNSTNTRPEEDKEAFVKRQIQFSIHKLQLIHQYVKASSEGLRFFSLENGLFHSIAEKIFVWKDVFYKRNWKDIEMALVNCLSPYLNLRNVETIMKLHVDMEFTLSANIFGTGTNKAWRNIQNQFATVQEIRKMLFYDSSGLGYEHLISGLQEMIDQLELPNQHTSVNPIVQKGAYSIMSIFKDLKQLARIDDYIQLALNMKEGESKQFGMNLIERAFQVIGESLKSSDKSPTFTKRKSSRLKEAGIEIDLLNNLRDCLSHGNSLLIKQRDYNIPTATRMVTDLLVCLRKMDSVFLKLRYQLQMAKYKYQLQYIAGTLNELADTHTFNELLEITRKRNLVNLENEIRLGNQIHEAKRSYVELLGEIEQEKKRIIPTDKIEKLAVPVDDGIYLTPDELNKKMAEKKSKSDITSISSTAMKAVSKMSMHLTMDEPTVVQTNRTNDNFLRDLKSTAKELASFKADETIDLYSFEYTKELTPIQVDCVDLLRTIDYLEEVRILKSDIESAEEQCQNKEPIWMADRMKQFSTKLTKLSDSIFVIPTTTETWTEIQFKEKCKEYLQLNLFRTDVYHLLIKILQSLVEYNVNLTDINISEICIVNLRLEPRVVKFFKECLERLCHQYNQDKAIIDLVYEAVKASSLSAENKSLILQNFKRQMQYHYARQKLLKFIETEQKRGKKHGKEKKGKKDGNEKGVHQPPTLSKDEYEECATVLNYSGLPSYYSDASPSDKKKYLKELEFSRRNLEVSVKKPASTPESQYTLFLKTAKSSRGVNDLCKSFLIFVCTLCSNNQQLQDSVFDAFTQNEFNKLCTFYKKRLTQLKNLDTRWDIRSAFQRNSKLRAAVEMVLLDMTDTWKQLCDHYNKKNERIFNLLLGHVQDRLKMSIRNYLAHGDVLLESSNLYCLNDNILVEAAQAYLENGQMLLNLVRLWKEDQIKAKLIDAVSQTIYQPTLPIEFSSYREALTELQNCKYWIGWIQDLSASDAVPAQAINWNEQSVIDTNFLLAEELILRINFRLISVDYTKQLFKVFGCHAAVAAALDHTTSDGWTLALTMVNLSHTDSDWTEKLIEYMMVTHHLNIDTVLDEYGATVLHLAVIHNNRKLTEAIIKLDTKSLNKRTRAGCTALSLACQRNYYDICELLLAQPKVEINRVNASGWAPIHFAVNFSTECLHLLLLSPTIHVNVPGPDGTTALLLAIENSDSELSKKLLNAGADINMRLSGRYGVGRNCFHYAASVSSKEILMLLADYGAVPHALTKFQRGFGKRNALHWATVYGAFDNVKCLIEEFGLDIQLKDQEGRNPFDLAVLNEQKKIAQYFLSKFEKVLGTSSDTTQLQIYDALIQGDLIKLQKFHGLKLNISSRLPQIAAVSDAILMPVCLVASKGHKETLKFLFSIGADMESMWDGFGAIHYAILNAHSDVVLYLVNQVHKKQCELRTTGETELNAIEMAASCGELTIMQLLQTHYNKKQLMLALLVAANNEKWHLVDTIIEDNSNELRSHINTEDRAKRRLIHVAAEYGQWSLIQKLIENGADYNVADSKTNVLPILQNSLRAVEYIIEELRLNISNISWKTECGSTMVHFSAARGSSQILELINSVGVDLSCLDNEQNSTLHYACKNRNSETISYLLEKYPNVDLLNQTNIKGYTPFHEYLMAGLSTNSESDLLLFKKHGCNFHLPSGKNENLFHMLKQSSTSGSVDIFSLRLFSEEFSPELCRQLLNESNSDGWCPLAVAIRNNSTTVKQYLDHGSSPSAIHSRNGKSILHCAAESKNYTAFDLVLNALVSESDERTLTHQLTSKDNENRDDVLGICAKRGNQDMLRLLLKYSRVFDVDYQNKYGNTALHHVVRNGHFDLLDILLQHKPNPFVSNVNNLTPMQEAARLPNNENTREIKKMLLLYETDFRRSVEQPEIAKRKELYLLNNQQYNSDLGEKLLAATEENNFEKVNDLLGLEADNPTFIDFKNVAGETALYVATRRGYESIVRLLLKKGSEINSRNGFECWSTPLLIAVKCFQWNIADLLLDAGAKVSDVGMRESLSYVVCQRYNGADFLQRLIKDYSIDVNYTMYLDFEQTCLNVAIRDSSWQIVNCLLANGADVGAKDCYGNTALHELASLRTISDYAFKLIKLYKAKLELNPMIAFNKKMETPLHLACISGNDPVVLAILYEIPKFANVRDANDSLPLHQAIKSGSVPILEMLLHLASCLKQNMMNEWHDNMLPIHLAAANGKIDVIKLFMKREETDAPLLETKGRSIYFNFTAVDFSVHEGHLSIVRWFIDEAKVNVSPSMISIAIEQGNWDIAEYLLLRIKHGDDREVGKTSLIQAAEHDKFKIVKLLLEKRIGIKYINSPDNYGDNALIKSIRNNNYEMAELLLEFGANCYAVVQDSSDSQETCFHIAAKNNFVRIARLLLRYHPHGNYFKNRLGFTPSDLAKLKSYKEMVDALTSEK